MSLLQKINNYYEKSTIPWINIHGELRIEGFRFTQNIEEHDNILLTYINPKEGENILDAGCGIGYPTIKFAEKYINTNFYLLNNSDYQIKMIDKKLPNMQIMKSDFHKTSFNDNFFDKIYFLESFSHSLKKRDLINEIYRVLKPGGTVTILDFCRKPGIDLKLLKIHRRVYAHFPVRSSLIKKLFLKKFTEVFFHENIKNNITTKDEYNTGSFYCYDKKGEITDFGKVHKDIHLYNAHVQEPVFFCYKK